MENVQTPLQNSNTFNNWRAVEYRPELRNLGLSINGAIFLNQARKLFFMVNKREYYKFNAPCQHRLYMAGDSWQEELGMSRSEFDSARNQVATRITSGMSKSEMMRVRLDDGTLAPVSRIVLYWQDDDGKLWYWFNEHLYQIWRRKLSMREDHIPKTMQKSRNPQRMQGPRNAYNHSFNSLFEDLSHDIDDPISGEFSSEREGQDSKIDEQDNQPPEPEKPIRDPEILGMKASSIWDATFNQLELQLDRATFDTWLRQSKFAGVEDNKFVIEVHNQYAQEMLQFRLYRNVRRVLRDVIGEVREIRFKVRENRLPSFMH